MGKLALKSKHRILCGDSTNSEDISRLLVDEKVDIIFTDPPYNLQEHGQLKRTNKTDSKTQEFGDWDVGFDPLSVLSFMREYTKENAHIFVCTSNYLFGKIHDWFESQGDKPNYLV